MLGRSTADVVGAKVAEARRNNVLISVKSLPGHSRHTRPRKDALMPAKVSNSNQQMKKECSQWRKEYSCRTVGHSDPPESTCHISTYKTFARQHLTLHIKINSISNHNDDKNQRGNPFTSSEHTHRLLCEEPYRLITNLRYVLERKRLQKRPPVIPEGGGEEPVERASVSRFGDPLSFFDVASNTQSAIPSYVRQYQQSSTIQPCLASVEQENGV